MTDEVRSLNEPEIEKIANLLIDIKPSDIVYSLGIESPDINEIDDRTIDFYRLYMQFPQVQEHVLAILAPYTLMVLTDKMARDSTLSSATKARFESASATLKKKFGNDIPSLLNAEQIYKIQGLTPNIKSWIRAKTTKQTNTTKQEAVLAPYVMSRGGSLMQSGTNSWRAITSSLKDFSQEERIFDDTGDGDRNFQLQLYNKVIQIVNKYDDGTNEEGKYVNRTELHTKIRLLSTIIKNIKQIQEFTRNSDEMTNDDTRKFTGYWEIITASMEKLDPLGINLLKIVNEELSGTNATQELNTNNIDIVSPNFQKVLSSLLVTTIDTINRPDIWPTFDSLNNMVRNDMIKLWSMIEGAQRLWEISIKYIEQVKTPSLNDEDEFVTSVIEKKCYLNEKNRYLIFPKWNQVSRDYNDHYTNIITIMKRYKTIKRPDFINGSRTNFTKAAPLVAGIGASIPLLAGGVSGGAAAYGGLMASLCAGTVCPIIPLVTMGLTVGTGVLAGTRTAAALNPTAIPLLIKVARGEALTESDAANLATNAVNALGDLGEAFFTPEIHIEHASVELDIGISIAMEEFKNNVEDIRNNPEWLRSKLEAEGDKFGETWKYCRMMPEDITILAQIAKAATDTIGLADYAAREQKCRESAIRTYAVAKLRASIEKIKSDIANSLRDKLSKKAQKIGQVTVRTTNMDKFAKIAEKKKQTAIGEALVSAFPEESEKTGRTAPKPVPTMVPEPTPSPVQTVQTVQPVQPTQTVQPSVPVTKQNNTPTDLINSIIETAIVFAFAKKGTRQEKTELAVIEAKRVGSTHGDLTRNEINAIEAKIRKIAKTDERFKPRLFGGDSGTRKLRRKSFYKGGSKTMKQSKVVRLAAPEPVVEETEEAEPITPLQGLGFFLMALQNKAERLTEEETEALETAQTRGSEALIAAQEKVVGNRKALHNIYVNRAAAKIVETSNLVGIAAALGVGATVAGGGLAASAAVSSAQTIGGLLGVFGAKDLGQKIEFGTKMGGLAGATISSWTNAGLVAASRARLAELDTMKSTPELEKEKEQLNAMIETAGGLEAEAKADASSLYKAVTGDALPQLKPAVVTKAMAKTAAATTVEAAVPVAAPRQLKKKPAEVAAPVEVPARQTRSQIKATEEQPIQLPNKLPEAEAALADLVQKEKGLQKRLDAAINVEQKNPILQSQAKIKAQIKTLTAHISGLKKSAGTKIKSAEKARQIYHDAVFSGETVDLEGSKEEALIAAKEAGINDPEKWIDEFPTKGGTRKVRKRRSRTTKSKSKSR